MNLLSKLFPVKWLLRSKTSRANFVEDEAFAETGGEHISLEQIKDLIIEAYTALDDNRRMLLLDRADRLEARLVAAYRAKGLRITADNICTTLEDHRRRHYQS